MPDAKRLERIRWLAKNGTPEQQRRARFYLEGLRPAGKRKAAA